MTNTAQEAGASKDPLLPAKQGRSSAPMSQAAAGEPKAPSPPAAASSATAPQATLSGGGAKFLRDGILNQLMKLIGLTWVVSCVLSYTPRSMFFNFPLACVLVVGAQYVATQIDIRVRAEPQPARERRTYIPKQKKTPAAPALDERWRTLVGAPVVEAAWEKLISNIIQEFVYDAFWNKLTPDTEFPAEVRRLVNHIFGGLSARSRKADVRLMLLSDVTDLMIETLELYRDARDSVGAAEVEAMTPVARDRVLRQEMKTEGNLHPALTSQEQHYTVLKQLADGALALLMEPRDYARPAMRSVVREMLASAVLKSTILFLMPSYFNKLAVMVLEAEYTEPNPAEEILRVQGEQTFEQKAAASVAAETKTRGLPVSTAKTKYHLRSTTSLPHPDQKTGQDIGAGNTRAHAQEGAALAPSTSAPIVPGATALVAIPSAQPATSSSQSADTTAKRGNEPVSSPAAGAKPPAAHSPSPAKDGANPSGGRAQLSKPQTPGKLRRLERDAKGFEGRPVTKVVAAEINAERRSREYVVFNIRVTDQAREWTVSRRFRNFEQLHKQLRNMQGFSGRLPPKRYFFHSHTWEFVEERREQLETYLSSIMAHQEVCICDEVFEFLNPYCSAYALDNEVSLLNVVSNNLDNARHSVKTRAGTGESKKGSRKPGELSSAPPSEAAAAAAEDHGRRSTADSLPDSPGSSVGLPSPTGPADNSLNRSSSDGALTAQSAIAAQASPPLERAAWPREVVRPWEEASAGEQERRKGKDKVTVPSNAEAAKGPGMSGADGPTSVRAADGSLLEDSIGISRPLYLLIDAVFELQSHGFIWRQVTVVVKQMLSLVAGGTVDLFIAQKMHDISSPHIIARLLLRTRNILWPGGVWFATARAQALIAEGKDPPPSSVPPGGYTKDNWFPLEAQMTEMDLEMAARLKEILFQRVPSSLVRIVGKARYTQAATDVYNILQSPTLMAQFAHGVIEILFIHLMPELKPLLEDIRSPNQKG